MDTRSWTETTDISIQIENRKLTTKNHTFNWTKSIRVFEILTHFVDEANKLDISKRQVFVAVPTILSSTV